MTKYRDFIVAYRGYYKNAALLNRHGAEVLPPVFDYIHHTGKGYAIVQTGAPGDEENSRAGFIKLTSGLKEMKSGTPPVTVYLNGIELYFDEEPVIIDGRVMAPARKIFESLGYEIEWDTATGTVTGRHEDITTRLTVGDATAYINQRAVRLDAAPVVIGDRTLVPLRFIAESTGAEVKWDAGRRRVSITTTDQNTRY